MADRYWAGGTGAWNASSTTVWSAAAPLSFTASSSGTTLTTTGSPSLVVGMTVWNATGTSLGTITGGSGNTWTVSTGGTNASQTMTAATTGASVPTAADNVFFTRNTTYTVTISGSTACLDLTVSTGTPNFGGGGSLSVAGSFTLSATTIWSHSGTLTFTATSTGKTITTNGRSIQTTVFNGVGGGWTLGGALTASSTNTITITAGSLDSANYNISADRLISTGSSTRSISLGSSTVTLTGQISSAIDFSTTTGLTFNAGTSQINLTGSISGIASGGLTFYNVAFVSTTTGITITGTNTFNTLAFPSRTSIGILPVTFNSDQTIGTLTLAAGTVAAFRTFLASNTIGTQRTLAVTTLTGGVADYDFRDIAITGSASPLTGTRLGDCKNNSGITFDAAKTVYYRTTGNSNWSASGSGNWSLTNNGSLDATAFPLPQDTAIFPSSPVAYPASGATVTISANLNIGTVDMSARTSSGMTLAISSTTPSIYGNWINGTGTTLSGTGQFIFAGRNSQLITGAGKNFTMALTLNSVSGSLILQDNISTSRNAINAFLLANGTLNLNGYTLSLTSLNGTFVTAAGTKNITFGGGTISINSSSSQAFNNAAPTGFTTTGAGTISMDSSSTKGFVGGGSTYSCTLRQGDVGTLTITGSNTFADITNASGATTSILFTAGTNNTFLAFNLSGAAGQICSLGSATTSQATLTKPGTWYMGANSTNNGNNTNLTFTAGGGIDYLSVSYINGVSTSTTSYLGNFFAFF